jgi:hypothetical protein
VSAGTERGGAQQSGASNPFTAEQLDQIERMIDKAVTERTADLQAREQELLNQKSSI